MLKKSGEDKNQKIGGKVIENDMWWVGVCEEEAEDLVMWKLRTSVVDST